MGDAVEAGFYSIDGGRALVVTDPALAARLIIERITTRPGE